MKLHFDYGDGHLGGNRSPYLLLHRILAVAKENLNAEVLLDPLEEEKLDPTAALVESCDRQRRQGQVIGQKDQRLARNHVLELDALELVYAMDQLDIKIGPDALDARLVGVGQRRAPDRRVKAHSIEPAVIGRQADLDGVQTLAPRQLSEGHGAELLGARQRATASIAATAPHDVCKARPRDELHDLREQGLADVHVRPRGGYARETTRFLANTVQISNKQNQPAAIAND